MKLIDMLVQELPKRGGWPEGVNEIGQDYDGELMFYGRGNPRTRIYLPLSSDHRNLNRRDGDKVTKDRYESALAASQKPAWNGEGMPPVGAKIEFFINPRLVYRNAWIPDAGTEMEVVAHKTTTDGNDVAVCYWDDGGAGRSYCFVPKSLKPLRTEAERKRDEAIKAMQREADEGDNWIYSEYEIIYDAIAAGKIPGVKLDD
nr:MAG TPA: hypothetical protein [Caudoviricetes sp.]